MSATPVLRVRSLRKSYGRHTVLCGVDLDIDQGEIVALLGQNGAGKTTLVSIIAGLRRADSGSVTVCGVDALEHPERVRPMIGLAPQRLGIYPTVTARENLLLFGRLAGLRGKRLQRRAEEVAAALELDALFDRSAAELSGGQQRRLHTAMAMMSKPTLLFLDEPTVGADVESRRRILEQVRALASDGCAVCYASHYLPEIEELEANVAVLDDGQVLARGSAAEIVAAHGATGLRLVFRGPAPDIDGFDVAGSEAFRPVARPELEAARVLAGGSAWVGRLDSIEMVRPSLESAYLALTGAESTDTTGVVNDVA